MTVYVAKAHETIAAGFTGETKRVGLIYDFAKDGGAYSGNSWTLATISVWYCWTPGTPRGWRGPKPIGWTER